MQALIKIVYINERLHYMNRSSSLIQAKQAIQATSNSFY